MVVCVLMTVDLWQLTSRYWKWMDVRHLFCRDSLISIVYFLGRSKRMLEFLYYGI